MFSVRQKREIAEKIQIILRETACPELPDDEIAFIIRVQGRQDWSLAEIKNNSAIKNPSVNPWNEALDNAQTKPKR